VSKELGSGSRRRSRRRLVGQSEGFRPVKQVGVAVSIGFPLAIMGLFILFTAIAAGGTFLWVLGGGLVVGGLLLSAFGRVI
jgi:hypothetical protein